ncbi:hypothetical protein ACTMU2_35280 [Cupriavidus basilensis]
MNQPSWYCAVAYGDGYQKPIVTVTLMAGFASTIFVPLAQWLE